jgi:hypothetical protein
MPATETKKTRMNVKYTHSEYCDRISLGLNLSSGKNRDDGIRHQWKHGFKYFAILELADGDGHRPAELLIVS